MPVDGPGGMGPEPLQFDGFDVQVMGDEMVLLTFLGVGDSDDLVVGLDVLGAADTGAALVQAATGRRPEWVPE